MNAWQEFTLVTWIVDLIRPFQQPKEETSLFWNLLDP